MYDTEPLARICSALAQGDRDTASSLARAELPFRPFERAKRAHAEVDALRVFVRDGFIDRYSGARLVCPAALRLLSLLLPEEIPYHPHWYRLISPGPSSSGRRIQYRTNLSIAARYARHVVSALPRISSSQRIRSRNTPTSHLPQAC